MLGSDWPISHIFYPNPVKDVNVVYLKQSCMKRITIHVGLEEKSIS